MSGIEIFGIIINTLGCIGLLLFGISEAILMIKYDEKYKEKLINEILNDLEKAKSLQEIINENKRSE